VRANTTSPDGLAVVLQALVDRAALGGWTPYDLGAWVRRRLGPTHLPVLAAVLTAQMARHPGDRVAARWRAEVRALDSGCHGTLDTDQGIAAATDLVRELRLLRPLPRLMAPPGQQQQAPAGAQAPATSALGARDQKLLARVRALLAKAESTDFPEEAEALSAKAQELISKHSLDGLMERAAAGDGSSGGRVEARRMWIDAPYVSPKCSLVHVVAVANRCSTVSNERAGFTTVAGAPHDLAAVELMTTSLMVQADAAMLAAGPQLDAFGRSRTASYRRAFLLAYATRIGQRLTEADRAAAGAARGADTTGALVPLLRAQREQVDAALSVMFPSTVRRRVTTSNAAGWAAGTAAADLARLSTHRPVRSSCIRAAMQLDCMHGGDDHPQRAR